MADDEAPTTHDPGERESAGSEDASSEELIENAVPEQATGGGFPEPPGKDPGDISKDPSPYHSLNNPVGDPDPTEWPDPYEKREDPRDAEPGEHTPTGAESTSDPHPRQDPMAQARQEKIERDNLDQ